MAESVLTGLCPLIPVPLLDDFARDLLRKKLVAHLARQEGTPLPDAGAKILASGYQPPGTGCAAGCLKSAFLKPIVFVISLIFRKLVRKILFFLTIKDAVETFSQTFHEAYLTRHALRRGMLAAPPDGQPASAVDPRWLEVRGAVEAVVRKTDTRPVTSLARSAFAGSRRLANQTAKQMARVLRRARGKDEAELTQRLEQEGEAGLGSLIDELTRDLEREGGYLQDLEAKFEAHFAVQSTSPNASAE